MPHVISPCGYDLGHVRLKLGRAGSRWFQVQFLDLDLEPGWIESVSVHHDSEVPRQNSGILIVSADMAVRCKAYVRAGNGRLWLAAAWRQPAGDCSQPVRT